MLKSFQTYLERYNFNLGYFVDFGLTQRAYYLRCTNNTQVVCTTHIHYPDYAIDGSFIFVTEFDSVQQLVIFLNTDLCGSTFDDKVLDAWSDDIFRANLNFVSKGMTLQRSTPGKQTDSS